LEDEDIQDLRCKAACNANSNLLCHAQRVVALEADLRERFPTSSSKRLIGADSGEAKRQAFEDINETLEDVSDFLYSPVIESGVYITVKAKKVYGLLTFKRNAQRAYLQMVNMCRCVEDPQMDILNGDGVTVNSNHTFLEIRRGA
jgi:hypothetical protein